MRKILILFALLGVFSVGLINGQTKQTVTLNPKNFVGVINKSGAYSEQKLANGIVLGNNSGSVGRGYVEFDLSKIPSDAKIEYAELKLAPKIDVPFDKFGGKVRLETAGKDFQYPSKAVWDLLGTIGQTGDYIGVEADFKNTATRHYLSDRVIVAAVDENKGKTVAFKLNHKNESGSTYIHLSGNKEDLILEVVYLSNESPQPKPPGGGAYFEGGLIGGEADPKVDNVYLYVEHSKKKASFYYDESLFTKIRYENNALDLKPKPVQGIVRTKLELKRGNDIETSALLHIQGDFPISTKERVIAIGENIEFTVPGANKLDASELVWETASANMTLVSGQGTPTASFKSTALGAGAIRVIVKYKNGKNQMITVTRPASVWVGAPGAVTFSGAGRNLYPYTRYKIAAQSGGGKQYTWSLMGDARFTDYSGTQVTTDKEYIEIITGAGDPVMGSMLRIRCTVSNQFGSNQGSLNSAFQGGYNVRVFSLYTNEVLHTEKNADDFNINNTNLGKGIYLIEKTSADGEVKVEKVMKIQE